MSIEKVRIKHFFVKVLFYVCASYLKKFELKYAGIIQHTCYFLSVNFVNESIRFPQRHADIGGAPYFSTILLKSA